MSRLGATFDQLNASGRKALVIYLTAGYPDADGSVTAALRAVEAGADILEIGVPFSDPVADGPVIQKAMTHALAHGGGIDQSIDVVRRVRAETDVPIVLFGYLNPLLWSGIDSTCQAVARAGADALLVVDLPPEESDEVRRAASEHGLDWVALVAPTTGAERAARIAEQASGFVYVVSMTGVTGGKLERTDSIEAALAAIRSVSKIPVCVGFGVRDKEGARRAAEVADGAIAGSVVVDALAMGGTVGIDRAAACVAELRAGVDEASWREP